MHVVCMQSLQRQDGDAWGTSTTLVRGAGWRGVWRGVACAAAGAARCLPAPVRSGAAPSATCLPCALPAEPSSLPQPAGSDDEEEEEEEEGGGDEGGEQQGSGDAGGSGAGAQDEAGPSNAHEPHEGGGGSGGEEDDEMFGRCLRMLPACVLPAWVGACCVRAAACAHALGAGVEWGWVRGARALRWHAT